MEDKELDFLVGEYVRFWGELGIDELRTQEAALNVAVRRGSPVEPVGATSAPTDAPPTLESLRRAFGSRCSNPNCSRPHKPVFGTGNPRARLVFVGEAPGVEEDASGLPFVGADGQLLTKIIEAMGLTRDQVYLTYAARCDASALDIERGRSLLLDQLAAIRPACVVALGNAAAAVLCGEPFGTEFPRGHWRTLAQAPQVSVMPTLPPALLLRQPAEKKTVWEDMKKVKAHLVEANS